MAMEQHFSFLLLLLSIVSLAPQALANCPCTSPSPGNKPKPPETGPILPPVPVGPIIGKPPVTLPPIPVVGPIVGPIIAKPPVTLPPIPVVGPIAGPIIAKPPVTLPPIPVVSPIVGPIISKPPVTLPPTKPKSKPKPGCSPPPAKAKKCPADTLKLGACLEVLGVIGVPIGDPAVKCCPLIAGLASVDAALCLCTAIKLKLLGVNVYLPIAVELLVTCGKTPPPGYSCA